MSRIYIDDTIINLPWVTGDPAREYIRFDDEEVFSDDDGIVIISSDDEGEQTPLQIVRNIKFSVKSKSIDKKDSDARIKQENDEHDIVGGSLVEESDVDKQGNSDSSSRFHVITRNSTKKCSRVPFQVSHQFRCSQ